MEEGDKWFNTISQQFVDEVVVIFDSFLVYSTTKLSFWKNSWPRNRESVCIQVHIFHDSNVFLIPVILIIGNISITSILYHFWMFMGESIPYTRPFATFLRRTFILYIHVFQNNKIINI
ncbi:hypothetical protein V8G54_026079 [Vigna mungo]|uniref:Uncharacterized protein n=1 Tax=Vigna mungo TaxID=3915 RepID=A0AAQ3MZW2_VIGMU